MSRKPRLYKRLANSIIGVLDLLCFLSLHTLAVHYSQYHFHFYFQSVTLHSMQYRNVAIYFSKSVITRGVVLL